MLSTVLSQEKNILHAEHTMQCQKMPGSISHVSDISIERMVERFFNVASGG